MADMCCGSVESGDWSRSRRDEELMAESAAHIITNGMISMDGAAVGHHGSTLLPPETYDRL